MKTYKIAMIGLWGVGKTSLVQRFVKQCFDEKYLATLGVKIDKKVVSCDGERLNLVLWDIAGAETNFSVPIHYIKGAAGYILVVDCTRPESLLAAQDLVETIEKEVGVLPYVTALNKSDLPSQVSDAELQQANLSEPVITTSAKSGENVESLFAALARKLLNTEH